MADTTCDLTGFSCIKVAEGNKCEQIIDCTQVCEMYNVYCEDVGSCNYLPQSACTVYDSRTKASPKRPIK